VKKYRVVGEDGSVAFHDLSYDDALRVFMDLNKNFSRDTPYRVQKIKWVDFNIPLPLPEELPVEIWGMQTSLGVVALQINDQSIINAWKDKKANDQWRLFKGTISWEEIK